MPALGILLGGVDFTQLKYVITPAIGEIPESAIMYGTFIQSIVDFLIIAFSIFVFIRLFNRKKKEEPTPEPEPAKPSQEVLLLEEIRDLIKENN